MSFYPCFPLQLEARLNHKQLNGRGVPLFTSRGRYLLQKGIRHKLTQIILLLPWKFWNTHPNFIIMILHFVLITKVFWYYYLLRISQQIYAHIKGAWGDLFSITVCSVTSREEHMQMSGNTASSDTQSDCKTFPGRSDVRNLSWPVSSGSES